MIKVAMKVNIYNKETDEANPGLPTLPHWEVVSRLDTISPALPASM